jgi:hypothetical protein
MKTTMTKTHTHTQFTPQTQNNLCPVQDIRPIVNTDNDHITIRCSCDLPADKYLLTVVDKIKGKMVTEVINEWEADLLLSAAMYQAEQLFA